MRTHRPAALLVVGILLLPRVSAPFDGRDEEFAADLTKGSLVLVPVFVNGRGPYRFVLDTGATTTMLDNDVAGAAGLRPSGTLQIMTIAGAFAAPTGVVDQMSVGGIRLSAVRVGWTSLGEIRRDDRRIAGILGQDVLVRFTVTVDYRRGRARLGSDPCQRGDTTVAVAWAAGRPMLAAQLHAPGLAGDARLVLDSAAHALIVFDEERGRGGTMSIGTHQSSARGVVVPDAQLVIGGLHVAGPAVALPAAAAREETGLLPTAWFSRVCIDGPRGTVTLTP
jgi:predicted aspartyl protease